jgi:spore germination cell wall hydrolase CwlJ-like protein
MTAFIKQSLMIGLLMIVCAIHPVAAQSVVTGQDVQCLADNISHEAPEESYVGQLAVATVTMNRVASKFFPKSVCDVVYQHGKRGCQFSWTCAKRQMVVTEAIASRAMAVAKKVLYENVRLPLIKNALYFHNVSVKPQWAATVRPIAQIGPHLFYVSTGF